MKRARDFFVLLIEFPLARVLLATTGLAGVGAGAVIAWREGSATPLLVVSAILVALGLFDWTELTARYGESSVTLRRTKQQIQEVAERPDVPTEAREQLQAAARTIDVVAAG